MQCTDMRNIIETNENTLKLMWFGIMAMSTGGAADKEIIVDTT